jgi:DNA gyrase inhibitor GyrI
MSSPRLGPVMDLDSFSPSDIGAYLLSDYERLTKKIGSDALDPGQKEVARFLRTDERMDAVWRVIFAKSSKGGFRYPSNTAPLNPYLKALALAGKRTSETNERRCFSCRTPDDGALASRLS